MNDYRLIFQKRAADYHYAMQHYPNARFYEFNNLISETNFSTISNVLDVPSGGGYLKKHLPSHVNVTFGDFSEGFAKNDIQLITPEKLPFESASFEIVFSLSGMHHLADLPQFVRECLRVTKTGGSFVFADVKKGTNVDVFLNEFVNTYNSLGHKGDFLSESSFDSFSDIQSYINNCQYNEYPFLFDNFTDMITFFRLFFGLDKASDSIIQEGIHDILGIKTTSKGIEVNWGLLLFHLKKDF